jgi:hypothetical protein
MNAVTRYIPVGTLLNLKRSPTFFRVDNRRPDQGPDRAFIWITTRLRLPETLASGITVPCISKELRSAPRTCINAMKEKVVYLGIPKRFIAGAVVLGDTDECAEAAKVTLKGKGEKRVVKANNYGDFEFEGLGEAENFTVKIERSGYAPQTFNVQTKVDVYLGEIFLKRSSKK